MAISSINRFEINGDTVYIMRDEWEKMAFTTFREDYYDELISVTWTKKGDYLFNNRFGLLHRYIMQKWYGEETLDKMTNAGWIVDHMNNDGFDCRISNLEFLTKRHNTAKGQTVDVEAKDLIHRLALRMYKDFNTGHYQITLGFNEDVYLFDGKKHIAIGSLKLLYDCDYRQVINDAEQILLEYDLNRKVNLQKLNFVDYKHDMPQMIEVTPEEQDKAFIMRNGEVYFMPGKGAFILSVPYEQGWSTTGKEDRV